MGYMPQGLPARWPRSEEEARRARAELEAKLSRAIARRKRISWELAFWVSLAVAMASHAWLEGWL